LNEFVSHDTLRASVWDGCDCRRNTIAKVACNLRRRLSTAGFQGLLIKGAKGNYMLELQSAAR
jgi:DNA-binding winged helix-turn-helix (wHTH) protein